MVYCFCGCIIFLQRTRVMTLCCESRRCNYTSGIQSITRIILMRKLNQWFDCTKCWIEISPASRTTRNHCPQCFFSLHVDGDIPGDRDTTCGGIMVPIEYLIKHGKQKIKFQCVTCGKQHINKAASDDELWSILQYIIKYKKQFFSKVQ